MSLTIVTPTYNRERELAELYDSLKAQTEPDFVWLIVDDGSTDGTEEKVRGWQREGVLTLRYLKKKNGGKHTCVNLAMNWVDTELVMIVPSEFGKICRNISLASDAPSVRAAMTYSCPLKR